MSSILIKNGMIYDGMGGNPFQGDLLIKDDRIAAIGQDIEDTADEIIDASQMAVTPGFIDIHRHCDAKPFRDDGFGEVLLTQGITTVVVGNCGISLTPASEDDKRAGEMYDFDQPVLGPVGMESVRSYPAYMRALDERKLPVNFGSMIGTGSEKNPLP